MTYIITIIITAILSSIVTFSAPALVARYRHYKTRKTTKLSHMISVEVEKQLKNIIND
jgi:hypothetical protein